MGFEISAYFFQDARTIQALKQEFQCSVFLVVGKRCFLIIYHSWMCDEQNALETAIFQAQFFDVQVLQIPLLQADYLWIVELMDSEEVDLGIALLDFWIIKESSKVVRMYYTKTQQNTFYGFCTTLMFSIKIF